MVKDVEEAVKQHEKHKHDGQLLAQESQDFFDHYVQLFVEFQRTKGEDAAKNRFLSQLAAIKPHETEKGAWKHPATGAVYRYHTQEEDSVERSDHFDHSTGKFTAVTEEKAHDDLRKQLAKVKEILDVKIAFYLANHADIGKRAYKVLDVNQDGCLQTSEILDALTPDSAKWIEFHRTLGLIETDEEIHALGHDALATVLCIHRQSSCA